MERPLHDERYPFGVVEQRYYTVSEVTEIVPMSDDRVRKLFRSLRYGPILEPNEPKPGKRTWRSLFIPYQTLIAFLRIHTKAR